MLPSVSPYSSMQSCSTQYIAQAVHESDIHKLALTLPFAVAEEPLRHAKDSFVINNSLPAHTKFNTRAINTIFVAAALEGLLDQKEYITIINSSQYLNSNNPHLDRLLDKGATLLYDLTIPANIITDEKNKNSDPTQLLHDKQDTGVLSHKSLVFTSPDPVYNISYCGQLDATTLQELSLLRWNSSFNWTNAIRATINHIAFYPWPHDNKYRPVFSKPYNLADLIFAMGCDFGLSEHMNQVQNNILSSTAVWLLSSSIFDQDPLAKSFERNRLKSEAIVEYLDEHMEEVITEGRIPVLIEQAIENAPAVLSRLRNTYLSKNPDFLSFVGAGALAQSLGVEAMVKAANAGVPLDEIY